ncbi:MAG: arginine--tRNA ligase [Candidatus Adiutrix sp.]|jgi:arginyl-tRNA synthetase|nr:arginine--tRNA ligase [Candidatus Adiutrix sp.]
MKKMLENKIRRALDSLAAKEGLAETEALAPGRWVVEEPRDPDHGHLAANAALVTSKVFRKKPADLADLIMAEIDNSEAYIEKMEKAGPGFINFTLSVKWWAQALAELLAAGDSFGRGQAKGRKVMVEYVSANPTGPLHVGHGRGAAIGDALCRVMARAGYDVSPEYYVNDAGRQMRILGESVFLRLKELAGGGDPFPGGFYAGSYIRDLAAEFSRQHPEVLELAKKAVAQSAARPALPAADVIAAMSDEEKDKTWGLIRDELAAFRQSSGPEEHWFDDLTDFAQRKITEGIKADLAKFRVEHEVWFSEKSLYTNGMVEKALEYMRNKGHLYDEAGALWFRSEDLGDDKNRVLIKNNGDKTYFAADIAYHWNKYDRGFDQVIDIWGADHHGYVPRMKAAVEALGRSRDDLGVVLVQLVSLVRDGQPVAMSTRAGEFVTLKEVLDEVGADAARFMFLTRSPDSALEFDLDLAKAKTKDNPVYYVQYVGARIESILRAEGEGGAAEAPADLSLLVQPEETALIKHLTAFPELIQSAAQRREPHHLTAYLTTLARLFHHYYGRHRIACDDLSLATARRSLIRAIRLVVRLGLDVLGVESPDSM